MNNKHSIVISVDPGFGGTGICMFLDRKLYGYANIKTKAKDTERYISIANAAQDLADLWSFTIQEYVFGTRDIIDRVSIVIESPHEMRGVKGNASLARGDVFKVAKLAGALGYALYNSAQCNINCDVSNYTLYYPEVRTWKGQTSKETTKRRVLRDVVYYDSSIKKLDSKLPDHVFDAAGIGLWFINKTIVGKL